MRMLLAFCLVLILTGCGTLGIKDPNLKIKVSPDPVIRGERALFVLNAPMDADKVTGVLEILFNPSFKFKKNLKKKYWYVSEKIPKTVLVPPGKYSVRLSYVYENKTPHYMRTKLELK